MGDEWAEAITAFDDAIWTAKESGVTKDELLKEVEEQYDQE